MRHTMPRCRAWTAALAVATLVACDAGQPASTSTALPRPTQPGKAIFYTKAGSLFVSQPPGTPGRHLTDGTADWQSAPSPDLSQVAFVRKASSSDYGGQLWVLDLSADLTPAGQARRLVGPNELSQRGYDSDVMVAMPRWSPTGEHLAFVANPADRAVGGGYLLVADAESGALVDSGQPPWAEDSFAWAADGLRIAWIDARSDVSPVNVNVLTLGSGSVAVATATNALSVTFSTNAKEVLFTYGEASFPEESDNPFSLPTGGIYSAAATPNSDLVSPVALLSRPGSYYADIATLDSGAVAFTKQSDYTAPKVVEVLDRGSAQPRETVTDAAATVGEAMNPAPAPAWGPDDMVAYVDTTPDAALVVTDQDNDNPRRVDTGVDSFGWPPQP